MNDKIIKDKSYLRTVIDSLPIPIFILDSGLQVIDMNKQSKDFFKPDDGFALKRFCGALLHCLHYIESEKNCGETEYCPECVKKYYPDM